MCDCLMWQPFRMCTRKWVCGQQLVRPVSTPKKLCVRAADDTAAFRDQVRRTKEALAAAEDAIIADTAELRVQRRGALDAREQQVWDRQLARWDQEMLRWNQERVRWDSREAQLQAQISSLQLQITQLSGSQRHSKPESISASATSKEEDWAKTKIQADDSDVLQTRSGRKPKQSDIPPLGSVLDQARQYLPDDAAELQPPTPDDFPPLKATELQEDPDVDRVRSSLQAAFSAVEEGDVMQAQFESSVPSPSSLDNLAEETQQRPAELDQPPALSQGSDDIFWMSHLHKALLQADLFPGEEDMENWVFGEHTLNAVLSFQAIKGLPESGIVDQSTWKLLLGDNYETIKSPIEPAGTPTSVQASYDMLENVSSSSGSENVGGIQPTSSDPLADYVQNLRQVSELQNRKRNNFIDRQDATAVQPVETWPILREGDGGRNVHYLHVALEKAGFIADSEDQRWWQFGISTQECLYTFQACSGLPETGIVDITVWKALLGKDALPVHLTDLTNEFEDDLTDTKGSLWLLGEQRWGRSAKAI